MHHYERNAEIPVFLFMLFHRTETEIGQIIITRTEISTERKGINEDTIDGTTNV